MPACQPFTESEMIDLLSSRAFASGSRLRNSALFILECATGGRICEVLGLRLRDVLDASGHLRRTVTFTHTKNGCARTVDIINPLCERFLSPWLHVLHSLGYVRRTDPLFPSPVNTGHALTPRRIHQIYTAGAMQLGLQGTYGTHSCRKTWARDTYRHYHRRQLSGELIDPLVKLQEAGGWKTIDAARRYIAFMLGDVSASQRSLYPALQERFTLPKITKPEEDIENPRGEVSNGH